MTGGLRLPIMARQLEGVENSPSMLAPVEHGLGRKARGQARTACLPRGPQPSQGGRNVANLLVYAQSTSTVVTGREGEEGRG